MLSLQTAEDIIDMDAEMDPISISAKLVLQELRRLRFELANKRIPVETDGTRD